MFQRQTRQPFPVRNILLFAAIVLAFLFILLRSMQQSSGKPEEETEETNGGGLRPAEWLFTMREYPDFRTDVKTYAQAIEQAGAAAVQRGANPGFSAPWTVQGPGNIGARVNCIKVHPTNPNIIYIGYSQGGVWKTTNGGQTWLPIFDKQPFLAIGDIELDPQQPNVVYVGTGDLNISGYPFIGDGIWRSPDGGQTWQLLGLTDEQNKKKIITNQIQKKSTIKYTHNFLSSPIMKENQIKLNNIKSQSKLLHFQFQLNDFHINKSKANKIKNI